MTYVRCLRGLASGIEYPADRPMNLDPADGRPVEMVLDLERFDYEMNDRVYRQRVNEHIRSGRRSGVRGMPAFFVNGAIVDISFGFDRLVQAVGARLGA